MGKQMILLLAAALLLAVAVAGCAQKGEPPDIPSVEEPAVPSSGVESGPAVRPEPPALSQNPEGSEAPQQGETASFALGLQGDSEREMGIGDTIGGWTLADLQILYFEDGGIRVLEAEFAGEVTLQGLLSLSALVENSYDFQVDAGDAEQIPCYISPETGVQESIQFMLNIPPEIAGDLTLSQDERRACEITVNSYHCTFAYMVAPPYATVVSLRLL